jgi:hypothetical protein
MSEWNPEGSRAAYHPLRRLGVPRRLQHLGNLITDLGGGRGPPDRLFWRWQRVSYRASFRT